jgi:hypothetical protein
VLPTLIRQILKRHSSRHYSSILSGASPFVLVLIVFVATIISSFSKRVFGMALAFDSAMYLHTASCVLSCLQSLCLFKLPDPHTYQFLVDGMLLDGPILPLLGGFFFGALGLKPETQNIQAALVLQAILQAVSALLVYKTTLAMARKRVPALVAGYTWGLYPAALLGAGKFMTEILTCCLVMGLILAISDIGKKKSAFAAGALLCMIALTKAALTPAAAVAIAFGLYSLLASGAEKTRLLKAALATICGATLTIAPWLLFTQYNLGQPLLTSSRQPTHNLICGVNPENDGWASLPDTPLGMMFSEDDPALPSAIGVAMPIANFELQLMARKVARLFSQPWNDYRLHCLGLPDFVQIFWHRLIISLAVFGLIAIIVRQRTQNLAKYVPARSELVFCLLLIMAAGHFIYLPFVACNRYGFTAMPMLIVLATSGLAILASLGNRAFSTALVLFAAAFMFQFNIVKAIPDGLLAQPRIDLLTFATMIKVVVCLLAINYMVRLIKKQSGITRTSWVGNAFLSLITTGLLCTTAADTYYEPFNTEHTFKITNDNPLMRVCRLDKDELNDPNLTAAYLLVDSRINKVVSGTVDVNGHFLPLLLVPLCWLNPQENLAACYEMFAKLRNQTSSDLRQWYALELPKSSLRAGLNSIVIAPSAQTHLEVNGTTRARPLQGQYVDLPSLKLFSPTILGNDLGGIDARPRERLYVASGEGERLITDGIASTANTAKSNANVLVLLVYKQGQESRPDKTKPTSLAGSLMVLH